MENKKFSIFISYSHDSEPHKSWVASLADDLERIDELNVTYDQFDLKSSADKNAFMEEAINSADAIVIVSTECYVSKANKRKGGVGIEAELITNRKYNDTSPRIPIIAVLRQGEHLPRFLDSRVFIDFRDNDLYEDHLNELLKGVKDISKVRRPKKMSSLNDGLYRFTRVEELIKQNHRKRKLLFDPSQTRDFSDGKRIDFELWETKSPSTQHFLFISHNATIWQTVERLSELLERHAIELRDLICLKPKRSQGGQLKDVFQKYEIRCSMHEYTLTDYFWEYCVEDELKHIKHTYDDVFIDQPIRREALDGSADQQFNNAFAELTTKLDRSDRYAAKAIVAPGGMGKTTLCFKLMQWVSARSESIPLLIQAEELRRSGVVQKDTEVPLSSVFDLYQLYVQACRANGSDAIHLDKENFEIALITGRIFLIIDGLDEMLSLFPEIFNIRVFMRSLVELNNQLAESRVIITTRNSVFELLDRDTLEGVEQYSLCGFDETNCLTYFEERFKLIEDCESAVRKAMNLVKPLLEQDKYNKTFPYIVDCIATVFESSRKESEPPALSFDMLGKPYESNDELKDFLVFSILRREKERQQLDLSINDAVDVLCELVTRKSDVFSLAEVEEHVSILTAAEKEENTRKLLLNPLLVPTKEGDYKFRYAFLPNYFRYIRAVAGIRKGSAAQDLIHMLGMFCYGNNDVVSDVSKYFSRDPDQFLVWCKIFVADLEKKISDHEWMEQRSINFRALGFVTHIVAKLPGVATSREKFRQYILDIFGKGSQLTHLAFYGEVPGVDFKNLDIKCSRFIRWQSISNCSFQSTSFGDCFFRDCAPTAPSKGLADVNFKDCRLGDLEQFIESAKGSQQYAVSLIEDAVRDFFDNFLKGGSFVDKKVERIALSKKVVSMDKKFLKWLKREGVLEVVNEKPSGTFYGVSKLWQLSIRRFLQNNLVDANLRSIVDYLAK